MKCVSISPQFDSTVCFSILKRSAKKLKKATDTIQPSSNLLAGDARVRAKEEVGRCYFRRYHHNLSVTYFKYLRSFSIRLSRHDFRCLREVFALGLICGGGGTFRTASPPQLDKTSVNWSNQNGLVLSTCLRLVLWLYFPRSKSFPAKSLDRKHVQIRTCTAFVITTWKRWQNKITRVLRNPSPLGVFHINCYSANNAALMCQSHVALRWKFLRLFVWTSTSPNYLETHSTLNVKRENWKKFSRCDQRRKV